MLNHTDTIPRTPLALELRLEPGVMRVVDRMHAVRAAATAGVRTLVLVGPTRHPMLTPLWVCAVENGMAVELVPLPSYAWGPPRPPSIQIGADGVPRLVVPGGIPLTDLGQDDVFAARLAPHRPVLDALVAAAPGP